MKVCASMCHHIFNLCQSCEFTVASSKPSELKRSLLRRQMQPVEVLVPAWCKLGSPWKSIRFYFRIFRISDISRYIFGVYISRYFRRQGFEGWFDLSKCSRELQSGRVLEGSDIHVFTFFTFLFRKLSLMRPPALGLVAAVAVAAAWLCGEQRSAKWEGTGYGPLHS